MKQFLIGLILITSIFILNTPLYALCVNVSEANLRKGPGTHYEKTWEVFKYMPFKKLAKKGTWYKVQDVDGDVHWVYNNLITSKFNCAVVKVNEANVRSGPGTKFKKNSLSPIIKYESFKVVKRQGSWVKVQDEFGDSGWVFRKLLWIY
jgi:SH3-like domain-containing protein